MDPLGALLRSDGQSLIGFSHKDVPKERFVVLAD